MINCHLFIEQHMKEEYRNLTCQ
uniref:Uncharacterized protein n=1 Tax=Anguilla anguilla TaxID=7936 RepID=A0A0E9URA9_ANGAN